MSKELHLSWDQISQFTEKMASYFAANMTLEEALEASQKQVMEGDLKLVVRGLHINVRNGNTLRRALEHFTDSFPDFYINAVKIAEPLGHLRMVFSALNRWCKGVRNRNKYWNSIRLHPKIAVILTTISGVGTWAWQSNITLTSRNILGIAIPMLAVMLAISFFTNWIRTGRGIRILDKLYLSLPVFSSINRSVISTEVTEKLAVLMSTFVKPSHAISYVAQTLDNIHVRDELVGIAAQIEEGKNIGVAMEESVFLTKNLGNFLRDYEPTKGFLEKMERWYEDQQFETLLQLRYLLGISRAASYIPLTLILAGLYQIFLA